MFCRSQLTTAALAALLLSSAESLNIPDSDAVADSSTKAEFEGTIQQWRDAAIRGDADAQFNMGQAYKSGRGVKADLDIALDWFKRAAAQDHLQAADSIGYLLHYQNKIGDSLPYLQASADRGDPRAQYLLATELFNGVHIGKDWVRAYALMSQASSAGMALASSSLAHMDRYIPVEQRQRAAVIASELEQSAGRTRAVQMIGFPVDAPSQATPTDDITPATFEPAFATVVAPVDIDSSADYRWRIQLGAFSSEANAHKLWRSLESKFDDLAGLQHSVKRVGNVNRLLAGPFATQGSAETMCGTIKSAVGDCFVVTR